MSKKKKKKKTVGFPGGSVVKNPPASAGDTGLILIPHALEQISQCIITVEPVP